PGQWSARTIPTTLPPGPGKLGLVGDDPGPTGLDRALHDAPGFVDPEPAPDLGGPALEVLVGREESLDLAQPMLGQVAEGPRLVPAWVVVGDRKDFVVVPLVVGHV